MSSWVWIIFSWRFPGMGYFWLQWLYLPKSTPQIHLFFPFAFLVVLLLAIRVRCLVFDTFDTDISVRLKSCILFCLQKTSKKTSQTSQRDTTLRAGVCPSLLREGRAVVSSYCEFIMIDVAESLFRCNGVSVFSLSQLFDPKSSRCGCVLVMSAMSCYVFHWIWLFGKFNSL